MSQQTPNCLYCNDTGWRDTGCFQPWGEAIIVVCECDFAQMHVGNTLYNQICAAIMHHCEADADEDSIRINMHPDSLAELRSEMGPDTCILKQVNGRSAFGDYPISETTEVTGWKVTSNLSM